MKTRTVFLAATSLTALAAFPTTLRAQTAPVASNADEGAIIVTARKREESVQDVPLAINAFRPEQIEREGLRRIDDLTKMTAGLTFDIGGFPNDTRPAIRGMQAERGRPSVAVLLDGQDLSGENLSIAGGSSSLRMGMFDLERIEVVKGPQSTLYGRNAFAGAVNYISKAPSFDFGGKITAEVGNGSLFDVTGSLTGPIIKDVLAVRLNASFRDFGGYYTNPLNGGKLGGESSRGGAGSFLLTPAEGLKISGRLQYMEVEETDNPTAFLSANVRLPAPGASFAPPGPPGTPTSPCPASLTGQAPSTITSCTRGTYVGIISATQNDIQMSLNPLTGLPPFGMRMDSLVGTAKVEWDTGSFGTFHYQFGYLKDHSTIEQDGDFTSTPAPPGTVLSLSVLQALDYRNKHTDHTAYWTYDSQRFNVILGVQKFEETSSLINSSQFWLRSPTSPLAGPPFRLSNAPLAVATFPVLNSRTTDYTGFFGGASFEIIKGLKISGEVRHNRDSITYTSSGWRRQDVSLSKLTPTCLPGFAQGATFSASAPATTPPPGVVVACPQAATISDSRWTPRATLEYKWNPDILTYISWAKGFKPGGFNTNEIVSFTDQGYRAETVETWEIGLKSKLFDRRVTFNIDAYRNRYKNQQIGVQLTSGTPPVTTAGIVNAGAVNIWGIEADIMWRVADPVTLSLSYAYTDAKYGSYVQGPPPGSAAAAFTACGVPVGQTSSDQNRAEAGNACGDFTGKQVGKNAKHALNMSALYSDRIGTGNDSFFFELTSSFRSERFVDESNLAILPSYWLFAAKTGLELGPYSLTLLVENIFDNRTIQSSQRNIDFGTPEGFAPGRGFLAYLPKPRTFGLRFGAKF